VNLDGEPLRSLGIAFTAVTYQRLRETAAKAGKSMSAFVRALVEEKLDEQPVGQELVQQP
jgi:predicted DNA-binding protein